MKKLFMVIMICCILTFPTLINASSLSTSYGDVKITDISLSDDEIIFKTTVNAKDTNSKYFVVIDAYKYKDNTLRWKYETGYRSEEVFGSGSNLKITITDLLENIRWGMDDGIYCFRAVLHDAIGFEENDQYTACFAMSDYICKYVKIQDDSIEMLNYNCDNYQHIYSGWKTTKEPTVTTIGMSVKTCYCCGNEVSQIIEKVVPTIELSKTSKTIRKKHSFKLIVSEIANGDEIESVKVSSKNIVSVDWADSIITIKGKKVGATTVSVQLKSGKKADCDVKVINDKFIYSVEGMNYSTRNNSFMIKIKNHSKHTVKIYAAGAKCIDWDYKYYDRNVVTVNGKSSVEIKPGKALKIQFKLSSNTTWPGYGRKTIKFKTKLDGKTKWVKISENDL